MEWTMTAMVNLRSLTPLDLAAVMELQEEAYPDVGHDSLQTFADKLRVFPAGCWGAESEGALLGYLFSHPWRWLQATTLDQPLALPIDPDCYYLHDLAMASRAQGRGVARALVQQALQVAQQGRFTRQALVAVHHTQPFWSRFGFKTLSHPPPALQAKLLEYAPDASYMQRSSTQT